MGTEVLRPQDCLVNKLRVYPPAFPRRKSYFLTGNGFDSPKPNNYSCRNPVNLNRPDRKRKPTKEFQPQPRKPAGEAPILTSPGRALSSESLFQAQVNKPGANQLNPEVEPGRITVLRRGQSLDSFERKIKRDGFGTKQKDAHLGFMGGPDIYAGSGFSMSPSPSSLPLPSFFSNKKSESVDLATRNLRRLLGLE